MWKCFCVLKMWHFLFKCRSVNLPVLSEYKCILVNRLENETIYFTCLLINRKVGKTCIIFAALFDIFSFKNISYLPLDGLLYHSLFSVVVGVLLILESFWKCCLILINVWCWLFHKSNLFALDFIGFSVCESLMKSIAD